METQRHNPNEFTHNPNDLNDLRKTNDAGTIRFIIRPWAQAEEIGYRPLTQFWKYFTIAEQVSVNAIYTALWMSMQETQSPDGDPDVKKLTELVLVLNHKIWQHYDEDDPNGREMMLSKIYNTIWSKLDGWCCENLKGKDAEYYYRRTD